MFKGGRPIDQLRLSGNTLFMRRVVEKQLPDASFVIYTILLMILLLFLSVVLLLLLQVLLKSSFTFYSSTFLQSTFTFTQVILDELLLLLLKYKIKVIQSALLS